jgi:hypothetical protein
MSIQTSSSRNPDINGSLNFSGPRRHNHNAVGQKDCFIYAVFDEHDPAF